MVADNIKLCCLTVQAVRSAASNITLSLVTTPTEKLRVKISCGKQKKNIKLQDGEIDHRQHAEIDSNSSNMNL
jgi:hypothetical protein